MTAALVNWDDIEHWGGRVHLGSSVDDGKHDDGADQ